MDNLVDLDESPIDCTDEPNISSQSSSHSRSASQESEGQPFKGSFLLEMERLNRSLQFERTPYSIYSLEHTDDDELFLGFMEEEPQDMPLRLNVKEAECGKYVLDFGDQAGKDCKCKCHCHQISEEEEEKTFAVVKKEGAKVAKKEAEVNWQREQLKKQYQDRKWTSLSLKEYKQQIKRKLQERR